jgi:hypothetical protein
MKKYIEAAQTAHDNLMPLVDTAIASALERKKKARADADTEAVTPTLVDMLNNAAIPADGAVTGIIATYAALLNNPGTRDGVFLIHHLVSAAKHHGLTNEQAAQIAGAILAAIKGKAPASLITWPAADDWQEHLHYSDLKQWAAWLAPAEYKQFEERTTKTAKARISAETDLIQLNRARQALEDMVPKKKSSTTVNIKNLTERKTGVSGIRWEPGETMALGTEAFAQLVDSNGFKRMLETKTLEVVA